jgi:hypothetical protein
MAAKPDFSGRQRGEARRSLVEPSRLEPRLSLSLFNLRRGVASVRVGFDLHRLLRASLGG